MSKARIVGSNVYLFLHSSDTLAPVPLGEIDSFSAKSQTTVIKSRPMGFINERATLKYGGWDLSFDIGKTGWDLAHFYWLQDENLRSGKVQPSFFITETIRHYNGHIENYVYKNVALFNLDLSRSIDEVSEKIQGFASSRTIGVDTTIASKESLLREMIFRVSEASNGSVVDQINNLERPF